jgi:transposase
MTFHARACELLVGLDDMTILAANEHGDGLTVLVESTPRVVGCEACGTRATVKDRPEVAFGDLACFGRPVTLVWRKVRNTIPCLPSGPAT